MTPPALTQNQTNADFFTGGGEMGERIRKFNWAATSLGPLESWPQSLRAASSICLNSNFPIAIYWGKDLVLLYNDSWSPIPGNKHPWALGRPAKEVWPDIWQDIEPQFKKAFDGEPGGSKDALLPMQRHGYTEECYFDFTFTPVYGESGKVEGVFNAVIETTYRVINERRTAFLKNLALNITSSQTSTEVYEKALGFIQSAKEDVPFALLYSYHNYEASLAESSLNHSLPVSKKQSFPFVEIAKSGQAFYINNLSSYFIEIPKTYWPEVPEEGLIVPFKNSLGLVTGFLVCGLSARLRFNEEYKGFIQSIANAITTVLRNIYSLEEERKKAEALSEIDRAKTTFFSNISHEFRTPLTLMLSPLEEVLGNNTLSQKERENLELSYRNTLRLQKLVNTLLDFSRIEAERMQVHFQPIDISLQTKDLASSFRSIIEKEGMELLVDCEPLAQPVFVDVDMWERIVLNLISNAFKYTTQGSIEVAIKQKDHWAQLTIRDTGIGIPKDQLLKIFDRFHRVNNTGGRSQEGTGIGLSLVQELVNIHGGSISVESEEGKGSVFIVLIPFIQTTGNEERIAVPLKKPALKKYNVFAEEASKWTTAGINEEQPLGVTSPVKRNTILIADDNKDMQEYITRLLVNEHNVITVANGEEAWAAALKRTPDLIISDVMMPKLDGFGLLKRLRENDATKNIPFIFLSARAGEEAKVEGLEAGADDYLVKPFSAKELLAKVWSHINLIQTRTKALQNVYNVFNEVPFAVAVLKGESLVIDFINQYNLDIWQKRKEDVLGQPLFEARPDIRTTAEPIHQEVYRTGKRFAANEISIDLVTDGRAQTRYFNTIIDPLFDESDKIFGQLATTIEVTEQVMARKKIEESEKKIRNLIGQAPVAMCLYRGPEFIVEVVNKKMLDIWGKALEMVINKSVFEGLPEAKGQGFEALLEKVYTIGESFSANEISITLLRNGIDERIYVNLLYEPYRESGGAISGIMEIANDVTEQVLVRKKIEQSEKRFQAAIEAVEGIIWTNNAIGEMKGEQPGWAKLTGQRFEEYQGYGWSAAVHPDDAQPTVDAWNEAVKNRSIFMFEHRVKTKQDGWRLFSVKAVPAFDENGAIQQWVGVHTDVTEQVEARKKIEVSESRYHNLIYSSPSAIGILHGEDFVITIANDTIIDIWGKGKDIIGKKYFEALPELAEQGYDQVFKQVFSTGIPFNAVETPVSILQNGEPELRYYNFLLSPQRNADGEISGIGIIANEVTSQALINKQIKESEERFRNLADESPMFIFIIDPDPVASVSYWNKTWLDYTNQTAEEAAGRAWDGIIHPDDVPLVMEYYVPAFTAKEPYFIPAVRVLRHDSEYRWHAFKGNPRYAANGDFNGYIGVGYDVHELKLAEEKVKRFKYMADNATDPFILMREDATFAYLNKLALERWGYTEDEAKHIRVPDVDPAYNDEVFIAAFAKAQKEEIPAFETAHRKKDGTIYPVEVSMGGLTLDGKPHMFAVARDITERKKTETNLQYLATLTQNIADAVVGTSTFEEGYVITSWNRGAEIIYGYTAAEVLGKPASEVLTTEFIIENDKTAYQVALDEKGYWQGEVLQSKKDGTRIFILASISYLKDVAGKIVGAVGVNRDITERKKIERDLKNTKEQLELTFKNIPAGVYLVNQKGEMIYANDKGAAVYGDFTPEDLLQQKDLSALLKIADELFERFNENGDYFTPQNSPAYISLTTGQPSQTVLRQINRTTKEQRWYYVQGAPLFDEEGNVSMVLVTSTDITLQKTSEQAIRQSEEKFRTLAETLPHLVWITDEKGAYEFASTQWMEYSGLDPHEESTWQRLVHPDDMKHLMEQWFNSLSTGNAYNAEARLRDRKGDYYWHVVQGEPVKNEEGKIIKWVGAFVNIHDQKTISEKLEKLVASRTKELERSNEDLQQFAHVASHDLKEPIRKVRTFGSRLEEEYSDLLPEKAKLYLDKMQSAADRMFGLIDGVLNYSTLNTIEGAVEKVDLNKIFQNIESDLEVVVQQKKADINRENLPEISGSAVLLNQLFYNLINNALKFSKPGVPPLISIKAKSGTGKSLEINEHAVLEKEFLRVQICDNGIGFSQEHSEKIFKTFTRLNSRDKYEGTGLGLALCKKIAERHNGYIYATGKENEGACFYVVLPA